MAITALNRDWGLDGQIVRMVTTDTLATITTAGYWTAAAQLASIADINKGTWDWRDTDLVYIAYNGGKGFFVYDSATASFLPNGYGFTQVALTSAQIKTMYTTPVNIVPAPGSNKLVLVGRNTYTYIYSTAQYTGGGALGLQFGNTAAKAGPAASSTLAAATFNGYAASNNFELTPDNTDTLANTIGLGIFISNDTAVFATGSGTMLVNMEYNIVKAA